MPLRRPAHDSGQGESLILPCTGLSPATHLRLLTALSEASAPSQASEGARISVSLGISFEEGSNGVTWLQAASLCGGILGILLSAGGLVGLRPKRCVWFWARISEHIGRMDYFKAGGHRAFVSTFAFQQMQLSLGAMFVFLSIVATSLNEMLDVPRLEGPCYLPMWLPVVVGICFWLCIRCCLQGFTKRRTDEVIKEQNKDR